MRSLRHILPIPFILSILIANAQADFVILKSGERVEGKIDQENDKTVTVTVQVSPTISDDRVIQKSDIARISKTAPDEEAFQSLLAIQPGPNSLSEAQYTQIIAYLNAFVAKFPKSSHVTEITQTIKNFQADKKRVASGEVKMNGAWLSKEQVRLERVQIGGVFAFENMKSQAASGDLVGALNSFVLIEKTFAGARTYPDAIELAKHVLVELKPLVDTALVNEKIHRQELEKGWKAAGPKDRADMMAAYKLGQSQAEAMAKNAQSAGQWPPFDKDSEKCLKALQTKIPTEYTRLLGLAAGNFRNSVELSDQAARQAASGQDPEAKASLKEALSLWPANEAAKRLQDELSHAKTAPQSESPHAPSPSVAAPSKTARP